VSAATANLRPEKPVPEPAPEFYRPDYTPDESKRIEQARAWLRRARGEE